MARDRMERGRMKRAPMKVGLGAAILIGAAGCALPQWPVQGPITSPYGMRWISTLPSVHHGVDISVPTGTPVESMASGRVRFAGEQSGYGRIVWIDHGGDLLSAYAHLSEILVEVGEEIEKGQVIARSGASGNVTAPHLHFEVWKNGRELDPVQMLGGRPGGEDDEPEQEDEIEER